MEVKFVGKKFVNYVSKKTNKEVMGYSLYFLEQGRSGVEGYSCFDLYVNEERYNDLFVNVPLGSVVNLCYDRDGSLTSVNVIK